MVDWRTYRIASKTVSSSYILFSLDNYVNYNNGSNNYKHIYCSNYSPFYSWRENDFIEINNDITRHRDSGYHFSRDDELRFSCNHGCGHSREEYDELKEKCDKLERESSDLRNERDNWRKKYDEIKDQLSNEKLGRQISESTLRTEKRVMEEKIENFGAEKASFLKKIEDGEKEFGLIRVEKDNQLKSVENKLIQKEDKLKELERIIETLRINSEKIISQKDNSLQELNNKLKRRYQEVKNLQDERFKTQEELLIEKLNMEKSNLEVFASELGINLEEINSLTKHYKRLLFARKERDRTIVEDSEGKIAENKQILLISKISIEDVRKITLECEKLAMLNWDLEQVQQQHEAKQEIPAK
ncbi:MAG: Chromosome partition protein Smc [Mycoplasmataceae bacterium]|nr:MAG: Chromosome partition protein Smc [Mycoplasmataceae bacterium]